MKKIFTLSIIAISLLVLGIFLYKINLFSQKKDEDILLTCTAANNCASMWDKDGLTIESFADSPSDSPSRYVILDTVNGNDPLNIANIENGSSLRIDRVTDKTIVMTLVRDNAGMIHDGYIVYRTERKIVHVGLTTFGGGYLATSLDGSRVLIQDQDALFVKDTMQMRIIASFSRSHLPEATVASAAFAPDNTEVVLCLRRNKPDAKDLGDVFFQLVVIDLASQDIIDLGTSDTELSVDWKDATTIVGNNTDPITNLPALTYRLAQGVWSKE